MPNNRVSDEAARILEMLETKAFVETGGSFSRSVVGGELVEFIRDLESAASSLARQLTDLSAPPADLDQARGRFYLAIREFMSFVEGEKLANTTLMPPLTMDVQDDISRFDGEEV